MIAFEFYFLMLKLMLKYFQFFDGYNIEHTHVYSLSQKLGAPLPYDLLLTCLKL